MSNSTIQWVLLRLIAPFAIGGAITLATWGHAVFGTLVWSLFITHMLATFSFKRTHLLDTGSFFCLIFVSGVVSRISETQYLGDMRLWIVLAVNYCMYAFLSFIGRRRADRMINNREGVSIGHVVASVVFLFVAIVVCSSSKTTVGFLFVPGLLLIPVILFFALLKRESPGRDER